MGTVATRVLVHITLPSLPENFRLGRPLWGGDEGTVALSVNLLLIRGAGAFKGSAALDARDM